ncbi:sensor histidine kinase [Tritonibacter horizontis]|uniref:histidine kinase n=1 Tax=Tritonibacter horizontis TaxID=1768241 RepID=A0A132BX69_9RHOB|nr:ATP-binding protein [Tritonibacter horizontis]KUP92958.1 phytochrome-like protein cph1 [Tritonibacter horizontis]
MLDYIIELFSAAQFVPHAVCLLWRPDLLVMHGVSDFLIAAAYFTIPVIILKAVKLRPDLLHPKVARLFAAFITACALSHLAGLLTLWVPAYGLQGVIKVATAAVSIYTAIQLARLLPNFLTMPSRIEMARSVAEVALQERKVMEATEARDKLSEFAHIASHDLKAPMRGIANQARFLIEDHGDALGPDARRRLDRMQELCGQMDVLIATLLKYSRLGGAAARETVDPKEIIDDIVSSLGEALDEENARIEIETPLPSIHANPSEVATVLRNLIVNALTYSDADEKRILIGYQEDVVVKGRQIHEVFYVRDNGIGIDPEFHSEIFRMFKRLNQREAYGTSTGAGLAFVKKVIESNGGVIQVVSAPGQGSTFYFTFTGRGEAKTAAESLIFRETHVV